MEVINGHIFMSPKREILIELWTIPTNVYHERDVVNYLKKGYNNIGRQGILHRNNNLPAVINSRTGVHFYWENGHVIKIKILNKEKVKHIMQLCNNEKFYLNRSYRKCIWILPE